MRLAIELVGAGSAGQRDAEALRALRAAGRDARALRRGLGIAHGQHGRQLVVHQHRPHPEELGAALLQRHQETVATFLAAHDGQARGRLAQRLGHLLVEHDAIDRAPAVGAHGEQAAVAGHGRIHQRQADIVGARGFTHAHQHLVDDALVVSTHQQQGRRSPRGRAAIRAACRWTSALRLKASITCENSWQSRGSGGSCVTRCGRFETARRSWRKAGR